MWWEHCDGYFAHFSFSVQNYTKGASTLRTSPRDEFLRLALRNCGICTTAAEGKYCLCTHELNQKPTDDVVRDHVLLSSSKQEMPRRSPSCWFRNCDFNEYLKHDPLLSPVGRRNPAKSTFEFLKKHAVVMCPEKLFAEIAAPFNRSLPCDANKNKLNRLTTDEVLAVMLYSGLSFPDLLPVLAVDRSFVFRSHVHGVQRALVQKQVSLE
jgi:hypothetical protein